MAHSTWHIYGSFFVYLFICFVHQNVKTQDRRAYLERPSTTMEYKMDIVGGGVDCYYQHVESNSTFFFSSQVIRGGDGTVGVAVQHSNGSMVLPYEVAVSAQYTDHPTPEGYYIICMYNPSTFSNRLVNMYINVVKHKEWDEYIKEIEDLHLNIKNFTEIVNLVERNTDTVLQFQSSSRSRESREMALLSDNNSYVQNRSIILILVIIITCTMQVYFVRKFFDTKTGNTTSRT